MAFIFVHWERAKWPLLVQFLGVAVLIFALLVAS